VSTLKKGLKEKYDVVIVGAGPAGAATAMAITGQGLDTLIIEKAGLPRYKMCGGLLFPESVQFLKAHFGEIPAKVYGDPGYLQGSRTYLGLDGTFITTPFRREDYGGSGNNIRRPEFDQWLCQRSDASLAERCRLTGFHEVNRKIVVRLETGHGPLEVRTDYLVGADGALSRVRKTLFPGSLALIRQIPIYEEWYEGEIDLEPGWFHAFYDRTLTGFFASVLVKDHRIIPTTGGRQASSPKGYFRELIRFLQKHHGLIIKERIAAYGCVIHDMPARGNFLTGRGNVLLVGEAGGFNRCAEGITSALLTGKAAGESILTSMATGQGPLEAYDEAVTPERRMCIKALQHIQKIFGVSPFDRM
jgi:menaquinone-9 beta-reductase